MNKSKQQQTHNINKQQQTHNKQQQLNQHKLQTAKKNTNTNQASYD